MGQKKQTTTATTEKGILASMDRIISASMYKETDKKGKTTTYYKNDEAFFKSIESDAVYIAEQYGITPQQALLFTIIMSSGNADRVYLSTIHDSMRLSFKSRISIKKDLRALEEAMLIINDNDDRYIIPHEVNDLLEKDKPYVKPDITNLSTANILSRMSRIFRLLDNNQGNCVIFMHQIDAMILANPNTSIAKAANKYHVLKTDAQKIYYYDGGLVSGNDYEDSILPMERMLFYALCYRYDREDDDYVSWADIDDYYDGLIVDYLRDGFRQERLKLQREKIIEYAADDGIISKDHFKIEDSVKEEIFADCGGLHSSTPMTGTILNQDIVIKELFYDAEVASQVNTLSQLLTEERYSQIRSALTAKGMRTGFTCLFYGSPGTGKTETVYQLARNTGRDIIMVDVSKLKSCWVGESEKNFKSLFSRYRQLVLNSKIAPILLFNEADAIFGKRQSGAERAVDKMENSLQNILLQEMEDLQGILIATTNLTENLDKAFERRFLYKIKFNKPSVAVKCQIWKSMIPELTETDAQLLSSKYEFSGGQIENIVRKRTIQSILNGTNIGMTEILSFCGEEELGSKTNRKVIGF